MTKQDDLKQAFTDDDLKRRRAASGRLGWLLGLIVLLIYVIGLFIKR